MARNISPISGTSVSSAQSSRERYTASSVMAPADSDTKVMPATVPLARHMR